MTQDIEPVRDRRWWRLVPALLGLLAWMVAACNPSSRCLEDTEVYLRAGIYTRVEGKDVPSHLEDVEVFGLGREDSVLVKGSPARLDLPLDASQDSCSWVIRSNTASDTLTFRYRRTTRLLNFECGFIAEFHDLQVSCTFHLIDSLSVREPFITNTDEENVRLFVDLP